jgi:hypothetical protein
LLLSRQFNAEGSLFCHIHRHKAAIRHRQLMADGCQSESLKLIKYQRLLSLEAFIFLMSSQRRLPAQPSALLD